MSWRSIVVGEKTYRWRVGRQSVVIRDQNGKSEVVDSRKLFPDYPNYDIERAQWKEYFHVTPKQIATYIDNRSKT